MKKLLLLVATLLFSEIPLVEAITISTGPGNAVATATNSATFDSVSFGTNLNGYTEDGLLISVAALAFSEWSPASSGFSGGFHYPNGGVYAITEISLLDGNDLSAIEFNVASGWPLRPTFIAWRVITNSSVIASGVLTTPAGSVIGFADSQGFGKLEIGAYLTEPLAGFALQSLTRA